jgi:hypothetical protein
MNSLEALKGLNEQRAAVEIEGTGTGWTAKGVVTKKSVLGEGVARHPYQTGERQEKRQKCGAAAWEGSRRKMRMPICVMSIRRMEVQGGGIMMMGVMRLWMMCAGLDR